MADICVICASTREYNRISAAFDGTGLSCEYGGGDVTALSDMEGIRLAVVLPGGGVTAASVKRLPSRPFIILVMTDRESDIDELDYTGAFILPASAEPVVIRQAAIFCMRTSGEMRRLRSRHDEMERQISEIKLLDRAKFVLMDYLKMTEPDAHRYIQEQAMLRRTSRRVVAEDILKAYEF